MSELLLYLSIALGATTVGSMTGMGGGVIIKPLLDLLHGFNVETIGILSAVTVFSMAIVSLGRQLLRKSKIPFAVALPLALGSVAGGFLGQAGLGLCLAALPSQQAMTVLQNVLLAGLVFCVFFYMRNKERIKSPGLSGLWVALLAGLVLGVLSSFLGIGGGPINVAFIIYLFAVDTKTATLCSLVTILFAQISKLGTVALTTGFGGFDLRVLPLMVVGAIIGGFVGAELNRRCATRTVERAFHAVQLLVLLLALINIARNI